MGGPKIGSKEEWENSSAKAAEWTEKMAGKKIGDSTDATTFAKEELPKEHRILPPGSIVTCDYLPDRMNIHLTKGGVVTNVTHG